MVASGGWSSLQYPIGINISYSWLGIKSKVTNTKPQTRQFHNVKEFCSLLKTSVLKY